MRVHNSLFKHSSFVLYKFTELVALVSFNGTAGRILVT